MKSVLLIGMGMFGQTLGEKLVNMGNEVMIADKNEDIINSLAPKYSGAVIANCMNADNLKSLDIPVRRVRSCHRRRLSKLFGNNVDT